MKLTLRVDLVAFRKFETTWDVFSVSEIPARNVHRRRMIAVQV